jgi:hypothetical protein
MTSSAFDNFWRILVVQEMMVIFSQDLSKFAIAHSPKRIQI